MKRLAATTLVWLRDYGIDPQDDTFNYLSVGLSV